MALIKIESDSSTFSTPISNRFIDEYLPSANPAYVTVYILLYRHTFHKENIDTQYVSSKLNLLESDVVNALKYWEQRGLLKLTSSSDSFLIEFLEVKSTDENNTSQPETKINSEQLEKITPLLLETKPDYSLEEINMYMGNSEEVRNMIAFSGRCLGKHLNYNDIKTIYSFYDWLRLPFDVIYFLLEYCCLDLEQRSLRYIEKVALDWHDNNIETTEQAKKHVMQYSQYRKILKIVGMPNIDPTPLQIKFMQTWINEFKMSIDLIVEASNKTIDAIGKPSFNYTNKILKEWNEKDIKTIDAAQEDIKKFKDQQGEKFSKSVINSTVTIKPTRFVNFQQSEWEFDEAREERYIEEQLKRG